MLGSQSDGGVAARTSSYIALIPVAKGWLTSTQERKGLKNKKDEEKSITERDKPKRGGYKKKKETRKRENEATQCHHTPAPHHSIRSVMLRKT